MDQSAEVATLYDYDSPSPFSAVDQDIIQVKKRLRQLKTERMAAALHSVSKMRDFNAPIAAVVQELCNLLSLRNSLIPIGRLPTEVILEIFDLYLRLFPRLELMDDPESQEAFLKLVQPALPLLHACRRWRHLIGFCSQLWSQIHINWPKHVIQWMLERGGNTPLRILACFEPPKSANLPYILGLLESSRVKELGHPCRPFCSRHVPLLARGNGPCRGGFRRLALAYYRSQGPVEAETSSMEDLMHASQATLEYVFLFGVFVDWTRKPYFANMTFLRLTLPAPGSTMRRLLADITEGCPMLRGLTLANLEQSPSEDPRNTHRISFPSLACLGLDVSLRIMQTIIAALHVPSTCRASFLCRDGDVSDFDSWFALLNPPFHGHGVRSSPPTQAPRKILRTAYMHIESETLLAHVTAWSALHDTFMETSDAHANWETFEGWPDAEVQLRLRAASIWKFVDLMPAGNIRALSLGIGYIRAKELRDRLAAFVGVERLRIEGYVGERLSMIQLATAMAALTPRGGSQPSLILPRLRWLEFNQLSYIPHEVHPLVSGHVERLIHGRQTAGAPLDHLFLTTDWHLDYICKTVDMLASGTPWTWTDKPAYWDYWNVKERHSSGGEAAY